MTTMILPAPTTFHVFAGEKALLTGWKRALVIVAIVCYQFYQFEHVHVRSRPDLHMLDDFTDFDNGGECQLGKPSNCVEAKHFSTWHKATLEEEVLAAVVPVVSTETADGKPGDAPSPSAQAGAASDADAPVAPQRRVVVDAEGNTGTHAPPKVAPHVDEASIAPSSPGGGGQAKFLTPVYTGTPSKPSPRSLRGRSKQAEEDSVALVHHKDLKDLRSLTLHGHLPTVACITVLDPGYGAVSMLPSLVSGFTKQTYEGPSMLMLVYHYQNEEAAKAVQAVADGVRIFAVAFRGDNADIATPAAYRFGAWRAAKEGADLIARWDLEAYHGPERMQMQVHTLVHTKRAACMLHQPGLPLEVSASGTMEWGERTLIGEVQWMRDFWFPFLDQTVPLLEGHEKAHLAVLDAPELFIFVGTPLSAGTTRSQHVGHTHSGGAATQTVATATKTAAPVGTHGVDEHMAEAVISPRLASLSA